MVLFIVTELDAGSLYVVRRHEGLAATYGTAPTAVDSAKTYFLHNLEAMTLASREFRICLASNSA
jgi:glutathione S-transferase